MTGVARRSAVVALCSAALLAAVAPAASAASAAGTPPADPGALPVIVQNRGAAGTGRSDGCVKPSDRNTERTPWAQTFLRPESAWQLSRGAGVTVAVLGSGVDPASGALDGRLTPGPREYGPGDSARDCVGHGTFLAGLVAARRQDGIGFAGLAPEARILAVAVTDDVGTTTPALLAKGIRDAADGGARVIAVGVPVATADEALAAAVHYADGKGALVIAPAAFDPGNPSAGGPAGGPVYPAALPEVLAVSDLAPNGSPPAGGPDGGRIDLVAPGDAVLSVGPGGKGHFTAAGPSYATAVVAGTAALVLGYRPDLTPAQLRERLTATAYHPGTALPDPHVGYGTVDPLTALSTPLPGDPPSPTTPTVPPLQPPPPDPALHQATTLAAATLAIVTLTLGTAALIGAARRRDWRPGRWQA
ncbi:S8 family serine peptidase [Kitasatospora sp. NPDC097643]|uniref:S8 family serine peptidase n=1 Tax=Kitasatospora sp. NPDC097643 TaxID=3157230 RepID=UPI00332A07C1